MKVAIDISPVSKKSTSAHKVRGVGSYINSLIENLPKYDKKNEYIFFEDGNIPRDADLVHYPYFDPFFITLPSSFKKKTIVTVHDLTPIVFKKHFPVGIKGNLKWLVQKSRLKKADLIITDSEASKRDVENIVGVSKNKTKVVYLAADSVYTSQPKGSTNLSKIKKRYNLPDTFLLYVGDVTWNKNLPSLVRAVKDTGHKLVIVGKVWETKLENISNNPWNEDLKKVLKEIDGNDQFINLGFVSTQDLVEIYNLASALVMPSLYEGFGLPVLEAMSCGCPVITTSCGSLPEVGGDSVYYVGTGSDEIKDGIEAVLSNESLKERLSRGGLKQAAKFSSKKMLEGVIRAYEL